MRITLNAQTRLIVQEGADERRENLPVVSEVAAVIPDEYADRSYREIVLAERSNQGNVRRFSSIHPHHAAYLPLAYPLLFLHGDHDFHWGLRLWDCQNQGRKNHSVEWRQCYQDSMAIIRFLGPPTFFITVTANPNWPEVLR
jgi:hypothetical protein